MQTAILDRAPCPSCVVTFEPCRKEISSGHISRAQWTKRERKQGEEKEEEEINSGKHESNLDLRNLVPAKLISFSIREIREKANLI